MTYRRIVNYLVLVLIVAQIALVLVSWLVTAAWPELPMHSLLSSGGIRWLFASLTQNLLTPVLVWLMFGCMAYGVLRESGLLSLRRPYTFRQRSALRFVAVEIMLFVVVLLLLTFTPHAPLLSVTGELFPSSFSDGLVPFVCLALVVVAVTFGLATGRFSSLGNVVEALKTGFSKGASLWLLYILAAEFCASLRYFLGT